MKKETWKPYPQILLDRWAEAVKDNESREAITDREYTVKVWREMGRARPTRWAWALDGVSMSRHELLHCWGSMMAEDPRVLVWYFPGRGCWTNRDKFKGEAAQVLTLRDFIAKARIVKEGYR